MIRAETIEELRSELNESLDSASKKLKPCKRCGAQPVIAVERGIVDNYDIGHRCPDGQAQRGAHYPHLEVAISEWNRQQSDITLELTRAERERTI
ncbi:MAG: hypothetical protein QOH63_1956 [Acidobacteriota bacterium]|jgi:hypothetical protein|nr:hypothetical protein [Acidobacteriota bacterium]